MERIGELVQNWSQQNDGEGDTPLAWGGNTAGGGADEPPLSDQIRQV